MTFLGIVACQIGTAFAARTQTASLRSIGVTTNPLLLWGIAFEIVFATAIVTIPALQHIFGTATPAPDQLALLIPFPFIVWGVDELYRLRMRRRRTLPSAVRTHRPARTRARADFQDLRSLPGR